MKKTKVIKGIISSKLFRKPFYIHFYVTRRCNLKCKMCNVWKNKDSIEMTLKDIKIAANKIKKMGIPHVVITGGEPMLRKDIYGIIKVFSDLGMPTRLQTNGLLLDEKKIDKLIESGLEDITISVDTLDEKKQAKICGVKIKDIPKRSINLLRYFLKKSPKSMPAVNIVVSHKNLQELVGLIKYADSLGIWSTFVPVNLSDNKEDYLFKAKANEFAFTKSDKEKSECVYNEVLSMKKKGYKILVSNKFLKDSIKYIQTNNKKWKCDAGELYFSIFPKGQFSPCDEIPTKLNILDKDFLEKYKSKEFREFLRKLQHTCEGCFYGCWRETSSLINSPSAVFDRFMTLISVRKRKSSAI